MHKFLILSFVLFLTACKTTIYPTTEQFAAIQITELKENLTYLSSDKMRGRDTGSDELKNAAHFLANKLKFFGYKGLGKNASYTQPFFLYTLKHKFETMAMKYGNVSIPIKEGDNIVLYARKKPQFNFEDSFYYVQDGIHNDSIKQFNSDMAKNAIVLRTMISKEEEKSGYSNSQITRNLISKHHAKMVISIATEESKTRFGSMAKYVLRAGKSTDLTKTGRIQAWLKEKTVKALFKLEKIKNFDYAKAYRFKKTLSFSIENEIIDKIETQNVVALLEGKHPQLKSEIVAFGAHYDHLGTKDDKIYNGADDDGSGTVSTLQIAKAISLNPPKRSIMIIFHTGEEKGLLGSSYFSDHPLVDLKKMVAMFNMDMVGRSKSARDTTLHKNAPITEHNEIYLVGSDRISQQLHDISEETNKKLDKLLGENGKSMKLNYLLNDENHPENIYYRSDHWNYAKKGIPIIFYFDGIHVDYHQITDTVEKIDFEKLQNVTRLALATGVKVANLEKRLKID